ncbi:poly(rC)-binding protein 2 isoform X1 [Drosophila ficusphila]|uniref:poly(rC)-binding protein 2 isoform X1 n=1 Tax=Drosophila ficusphila TaxID=30025 RepID=UPI0007E5EB9D|nr:poly(rC)-binding protein 2 isoform X1 [Drosophila ficusphila]XP_017049158.1 poly(rC)-binding protein 2 isoform X1 [Drosophila ficusphila]XP_017049159.1 poly(rC)-binding protein 2 isoform X1 [Drosophila ficusphila]XP_043063263.1 poly(rC)-binding protein 2 isoform X1 [Drosophila ficusphila]
MEDNNTSSSAGGASIKHEDPSVTLTIRLIMQGKEVGSIIGKKGEIVNRFREESGAKINISDGSCPERIVTVSGTTNAIFSAFTLITKKFEEWCSQFNDVGKVGKTQIPIRLIVPASQCGSLIGKSGSKIKEIRQTTGCSIQVASEMLPNSTERAVTLSGSAEQITQCIYQICLVMLESPPRGATIPYRPKPQVTGPVILANGQAFTIQGNYAVPTQETCPVFPLALATGGLHAGISGLADPLLKGAHLQGAIPAHHHHLQQMPDVAKNPLASLAALGLAGMNQAGTGGINHTGELSASAARCQTDFQSNLGSAPAALAALAGSQLRTANPANRAQQQQHEMTVSNDLIGCIIGKGGTKIAEIRQISGAMIRISNCEEREGGNTDRTITISGNPDSVALAQYLINMSVELQKANLLEQAQAQQNGGAIAAPGAAAAGVPAIAGASAPPSGSNGAVTAVALTGSGGAGVVGAGATAAAAAVANGAAPAANGGGTNGSISAAGGYASANGTANGAVAVNPAAAAALSSPLASALQLLTKPGALSALSNLSALDLLNLTTLGNNNGAGGNPGGPPVQTTGVNRAKGHYATSRFRQHQTETGGEAEKPRNKFNPY